MRVRAVILDDEPLVRRFLWITFDQRGYEVFAFPDPSLCPLHVIQACGCPAGTRCADIIVSDVRMLKTNGIEFLEALIQKGCRRPFFALMSGGFSEKDRERASKIGCALFEKPISREDLLAWLKKVEGSISPTRALMDWAQFERTRASD